MSTTKGWASRVGMRPYQIASVVFCMFLNMLDGYDVLVMGFAMPHLPEGFATNPEKGYLISAALAGMAVGAIGLARFADVIGRRRILLVGLAANTLGLTASALSNGFAMLLVTRFVTGIAIGTISVVIIVLCQEVVPPNRRSVALGLVMVGYPLGTTLAGFAGAGLVALAGGAWQGMFWIGAALGVLPFVVTAAFLRESDDFLARKGTKTAPDQAIPAPQSEVRLLGRELRSRTLLLTFGYSILTAGYYFVGTWTPQLIKDASGDAGSGALAGIMISFGAVVGGCLFGAFGLRFPGARIAVITSAVSAVAIAGFALTLQGPFALAMAGLLGAGTFAAMSGFTSTSTAAYPVLARAKGYGAMMGVARGGAILSPIVAGYALSVMTPRAMYLAVIVPLVLAAVAAIALTRITRGQVVGEPSRTSPALAVTE
ncbi:MFS transporter [Rhodococcus sp. NCIMB 12038]|uniref:MFS transporter n=1 Tax=Rhodococcus sp. NCIMB 12038 TaxID=933800 RepID=UPI000B3CFFEE|nr:MFS transporter [Rhodococcus sp. NCIMB 12038]OUS93279.1 MFS transporter permease [Rhodococcus sp. NCIMB 12038]